MNVEKAIRSLTARGFEVRHFATKEEAADYIVGCISGSAVGIGGSLTIDQLDIYDRLAEKNDVSWHWKEKTPGIFERELSAEVFITGANAISENGDVVLIDARGNRLGSVVFGQDKSVYIVAGINKLCPDLDSAIIRARNVAAPMNVKRLLPDSSPNPCLKGGRCYDCRVESRLCNAMLVLWGKMLGGKKYEIILIDEELGL